MTHRVYLLALARYMIKYNVGVVTSHSFEIKRIDFGFFNPD